MSGLGMLDGTPPRANDVLAEYGLAADLPTDDEEALATALLLELRALRQAQAGSGPIDQQLTSPDAGQPDRMGQYHAVSGAADSATWAIVDDFGFVSREVDLRFDNAIRVAFTDTTSQDTNVVEYDQADSPVSGIPVRTTHVQLKAATSGQSVNYALEVWSQR
jgi:hypothetical protein